MQRVAAMSDGYIITLALIAGFLFLDSLLPPPKK